MARKKSSKKSVKKDSTQKKLTARPSDEAKVEIAAPAPEQKDSGRDRSDNSTALPTRSLVRLSSCIAGMFLTFVLGLYLGSLIPGIMAGMEKEKMSASWQGSPSMQSAPPLPAATDQEKSSPADSGPQPGLAPEMRQHLAHLEKTAAAQPENSHAWTELGNAYFDAREPRKAIAAYEHSLSINPDNPDVLTDLGIMHREMGNYDKALECFRKASGLNPAHINSLFNEGVVLSSDLGRKEEAARVWRRILDIRPDAATPDGRKISDMVRQLQ